MDEFPTEIDTDDWQKLRIEKQYAQNDRQYADENPHWHAGMIMAQKNMEEYIHEFNESNPIKQDKISQWGGRHPDAWFFGMTSDFCYAEWVKGVVKGSLFGVSMATFTGLKLVLYNSHSRVLFVRWATLWTVPSVLLWSSISMSSCEARHMDLTLLQKLKTDPRFK